MPSRFEYERAVRGSELPSLSRLLALTVATWADVSTGIIPDRLMPSLATLESATGMSRGAVRKHLNALEGDGWLLRKRPSAAAALAQNATTKYRIRVPAGAAVSDTDGIDLGHEVTRGRAPRDQGGVTTYPGVGHQVTRGRAPGDHSSSCSSVSSVEVQLQDRPPAAVAISGRGEVQPLIDAMGAREMRVSWTFTAEEWVTLRDAVRRVGVPALVDHATRAWQAAKSTPYSARYFLTGWAGLQAPTNYTGPRAIGAPSKTTSYLESMAALADELRTTEGAQ